MKQGFANQFKFSLSSAKPKENFNKSGKIMKVNKTRKITPFIPPREPLI